MRISFQNDRQFQCTLMQMQQHVASKNYPVLHREGVMHYMLGLFHVKLRAVWDIAEKIIKELFSSCSECREEFWLILCKKLESSYFKTLIIEDEEKLFGT